MQEENYVHTHAHIHTFLYVWESFIFYLFFLRCRIIMMRIDSAVNFALSNYLSQAPLLKVLG